MKKEFCVCLSHDVDRVKKTFQFISHFLRNVQKRDLRSATYQLKSIFLESHYWCFDKIMDIERKLGLRSTFFFLNETYPFYPWKISSWRLSVGYYDLFEPDIQRVIKKLDNQGWEVGLHGSFLSFKDLNLLKKEKYDIENIIGQPVLGVRQHYLNVDLNTWERQAEAGFLYDASFGFTSEIGFRENRFNPFKPILDREFYVVPLALMDACVMRKRNPLEQAINVVKLAEEKCACLVLNWHQRMFNEKEFPGYMDMYLQLIEECRVRKAHFCTIGEYVDGI